MKMTPQDASIYREAYERVDSEIRDITGNPTVMTTPAVFEIPQDEGITPDVLNTIIRQHIGVPSMGHQNTSGDTFVYDSGEIYRENDIDIRIKATDEKLRFFEIPDRHTDSINHISFDEFTELVQLLETELEFSLTLLPQDEL